MKHAENFTVPVKALSLDLVIETTGLGKTTLYGLMKSNKFPRPLKIGKASRWLTTDVSEWLRQLSAVRDANTKGAQS